MKSTSVHAILQSVALLAAAAFSASCGGSGGSPDAWYEGDVSTSWDTGSPDAGMPLDGGPVDGGMPDSGVTQDDGGVNDAGDDVGPQACTDERIQYGACAGGDLVTPCLEGYFGQPFCVHFDGGPGDATLPDAGQDSGHDAGWDIGPFPDAGPDPYADLYKGTEGLTEDSMKEALYALVNNHDGLGYDGAKEVLYSVIDNDDGWVECVYTGTRVQTAGIPPSSVMNTEHSWPQSKGASTEPARGDLNHLFPVDSKANSRRNNNDYGWVQTAVWTGGGSKLGTNDKGVTVFEPRDIHKGNAARAIFYFSLRYKMAVPLDVEEPLKVWNHLDPPDDRERARNGRIQSYQHTRNPFVDHPEFIDRIADF